MSVTESAASGLEALRALAARKALHVIFVLLMAIPLLVEMQTELYVAALTLASAVLYTVQVRRPRAWEEFKRGLFRALEDFFGKLESAVQDRRGLGAHYHRVVRQLESLITAAERDYEKRHGYLGVVMGAAGFLVSLTLFGRAHLFASVISMAVYDAVSAVAGALLGGRRVLNKITLWGTALGAAANTAALIALGAAPLKALIIVILVILADALSPEDNLTIPVAAAAGSYIYDILLSSV